jgi:hypothetical protein
MGVAVVCALLFCNDRAVGFYPPPPLFPSSFWQPLFLTARFSYLKFCFVSPRTLLSGDSNGGGWHGEQRRGAGARSGGMKIRGWAKHPVTVRVTELLRFGAA